MSEAHTRSRVDWGHLALILFFATVTVVYLADAWDASGSFRNLVLVLPASVLSLILCAIVAVGAFRSARTAEPEPASGDEAEAEAPLLERLKPALLMALFALYIATLPWLGFDVGSAVFVAAALMLDGERRLWLVAPVAVGFALVATLLFRWLLPYPMPLLVL